MPDNLPSPLVTIATINKNNAANLPKTIRSIEKLRKHSEVECIFIDGNSSDESVHIAKQFYDHRQLVSEPDDGIYDAMNKSLRIANGDFVLWLNSGDELLADRTDTFLDVLQNTKGDVVSFGIELWRLGATQPEVVWRPKAGDLPTHTLPHGTSFFRRSTLQAHAGYCKRYRIAADREAFVRLYRAGAAFEYHDEVIGRFYLGGMSSHWRIRVENLQIDRAYGLVHPADYFWKLAKLRIKRLRDMAKAQVRGLAGIFPGS